MRWKDNVKMDLKVMVLWMADWTRVIQDCVFMTSR